MTKEQFGKINKELNSLDKLIKFHRENAEKALSNMDFLTAYEEVISALDFSEQAINLAFKLRNMNMSLD